MNKGDFYFKATQSRFDSWATVQSYEVYHYSDKTKVLAVVTNRAKKKPFNNYLVTYHGKNHNITRVFKSLDEILEFLVEESNK